MQITNLFNAITRSPFLLPLTIITILLSPAVWNILGYIEYTNKTISRLFKSRLYGVYFVVIISQIISRIRDILVVLTAYQTRNQFPMPDELSTVVGVLGLTIGSILVLSSSHKLGIVNTYHGDHFGFYLEEKITSFPFNILNDPMYVGSSMIMVAIGFAFKSYVGVGLGVFAFAVYQGYIKGYEEGFTDFIYKEKADRERERKEGDFNLVKNN